MIQTKTYILKSKDIPLLSFAYHKDTALQGEEAYSLEVQNVYDSNAYLLPKGLRREDGDEVFQNEFYTWLTKRKIPVGRANAQEIIKHLGDTKNPLRYVQITRGLSLNDSYWVVEPEDTATWVSCNLYTNPFDVLLEHIAFEGASKGVKKSVKEDKRILSPEVTTNGMLRKCWYRNNKGEIILRKAEEPTKIKPDGRSVILMEYYATQLAEVMGLPHVKYTLDYYKRYINNNLKQDVVCECPLFTSENIGFVDAGALVREWYYSFNFSSPEQHKGFAEKFAPEFYSDMMLFDTLICNWDRHFGNFGYLIDNNTGEYLGPAPLFDNGNCLLATGFSDMTPSAVHTYLDNPLMPQHGKFLKHSEQIETFASERHLQTLYSLRDFEFRQPDKKELQIDPVSIEAMNTAIQIQTRKVLKFLSPERDIPAEWNENNDAYLDW